MLSLPIRFAMLCLLWTCCFTVARAGWPTEVDSALFVDFGLYPYVVVDGSDQSVMVVYIYNGGLYAKKYDRFGEPQWGGNRVTLADTTRMFGYFLSNLPSQWGAVVSDDSGGAWICWQDYRDALYDEFIPYTNDIYLQHVDRNGIINMGTQGTRLNIRLEQGHLLGDMKPDHQGGVYVGFSHDSTDTSSVLKRIGYDGTVLWERYLNEAYVDVCASNSQGEIFVNFTTVIPWKRQKLDKNGTALWPDTLSGQIPDDLFYVSGSAYGDKMGGSFGIYRTINETVFNRVLPNGQLVFEDGIVMPTTNPPMHTAPDGKKGIYFQATSPGGSLKRIRCDGTLAWSDTVRFCIGPGCLGVRGIVQDNRGGVVAIFSKGVGIPGVSFYSQRVDSSGQFLWGIEGLKVYETLFELEGAANPVIPVIPDGRGGAIFHWVLNAQGFRIFIKQVSANGILGEVTTGLEEISTPPYQSILLQNYPNPFNSTTLIQYTLTQSTRVDLSVYNLLGQKVASLISQEQSAGEHRVEFDASLLSSGIYFYRLQIDKNTVTSKKMLIIN